jgi:hypothetical protein
MTLDDLQRVANLLVKAYGHEIVRDGDWWWGMDDYDFNIHNTGDTPQDCFTVNVYECALYGADRYSKYITLEDVYIKETA